MIGVGARVGPYEVTGILGAGGMGQVFRARDPKLLRDVAVKVLPETLAADPERRARFEREAQVLASLNHPNIAGIHGFVEGPAETEQPAQALILELVEGPTLADRIAQGPIPSDEALPIARQIADALVAAHESGIVHRDLKPANIKLRPDGMVKVLDFGLAKLVENAGVSGHVAGLSQSPTITTPAMTQLGLVLGTAAYMSPEQARGRIVDRRADVWAFGCVLFEMLTGLKAFGGDDVTDTIAAVVRAEPDWNKLPSGTPSSIRRLLRRCLAKDVRSRLADLGSARLEIDDAEAASAESPVQPSAPGHPYARRPPRLAWATAALLLSAVAALAAFRLGRTPPRLAPVRFELAMPAEHTLTGTPNHTDSPGGPASIAVSPDGTKVAFLASRNGRSRLWLRTLATFESREIAGTEGASGPFWSPDSRWIGFFSAGSIRKVDTTGGAPQSLCTAAGFEGGSWGGDNVILFSASGVIQLVSASGGEPRPVTTLGDIERAHVRPTFLPGSTRFAYASVPSGTIYVTALEAGERSVLFPASADTGANVSFARDHVLFMRGTSLMAQGYAFDGTSLTGEPALVAPGVEGPRGVGFFSSSLNGVLAYQSGVSSSVRRLTWFRRDGPMTPAVTERANYDDIEISPDGSKAAVSTGAGDGRDLWIINLARGVLSRFTSTLGAEQNAVWSPDGASLTFLVEGNGIFRQRLDGSATPQVLLAAKELSPLTPNGLSPDGRVLLVNVGQPINLWQIRLPDQRPSPFVQSKAPVFAGQFSPDGRWVSYHSNESGRNEVYVTAYPGPGERIRISPAGGQDARWRGDGDELFYIAPDGNMMAVTVNGSSASFKVVGDTRALFPFRKSNGRWPYDVTRDGQRFLAITADDQAPTPVRVVVNWTADLDADR